MRAKTALIEAQLTRALRGAATKSPAGQASTTFFGARGSQELGVITFEDVTA
jgi:hypothetical protein